MRAFKQAGAAMVVAMLILSIVTVFAASIAFDYQFSIRRVSNQMLMQQAYQYLLATEAIAGKALLQDLQNDADDEVTADHKGEIWAEEGMVFTVEEGAYTGVLHDLQGRFNLNSLKPPSFPVDQFPPEVPYTIEQGIFIRLLQAVGDDEFAISEHEAKAITESIIDWLDADSMPTGFGCGEDDGYHNIEERQAHRVANGPFYSVSELRLICNLPLDLYYRLQEQVTVWPISGQSSININTASSALLRSILLEQNDVDSLKAINNKTSYQVPPPLAFEAVESLIRRTQAEALDDDEERQTSAYSTDHLLFSEDELLDSTAIGFTKFEDVQKEMGNMVLWPNAKLGLYSNYFLLEAVVTLDRLTQNMSSVISREQGTISVLARSTGGL